MRIRVVVRPIALVDEIHVRFDIAHILHVLHRGRIRLLMPIILQLVLLLILVMWILLLR